MFTTGEIDPDGIQEFKNEELRMKNEEAWYDLSGRQIVNGTPRLQSRLGAKASEKLSNGQMPKGINIIRYSDGTTRKLMVK